MTQENPHPSERLANPSEAYVSRPLSVDLFFAGDEAADLRESPFNDPRIEQQAQERRQLHALFGQLFELIEDPAMSIDDAARQGLVETDTVQAFYTQTADFIEQDTNNTRLALYLPFELLPDMNKQTDYPDSRQRFAAVYRDSWIRLLHQIEPRASFVDGDVLEPGLPEPEYIAKAGHITAEILAKGIIRVDDIIVLLDIMSDERSLKSLAEGATVARDQGLIGNDEWAAISAIISRRLPHIELGPSTLDQRFIGAMSPERIEWLRRVEEENKIDQEASSLADRINREGLNAIQWNIPFSVEEYWVTALEGIFKSGETSIDTAKNTQALLARVIDEGSLTLRSTITRGLSRWLHAGQINRAYINELRITIPDLSAPLPFPIDAVADDFQFLSVAALRIKEDPTLSKALYPTFLAFGSRVKGYAKSNADYDAAIIFKPHVLPQERTAILERLHAVVPEIANIPQLLEFWEPQEGDNLDEKRTEKNPKAISTDQVHFFLGGIWLSQDTDYRELQKRIIKQYVDLSRYGERENEVRSSLLARLELDALQYRLMHSGFRRFYPSRRKQSTEHGELIDWESDFWDPAYRRIASQLFLSKVFLPNVA